MRFQNLVTGSFCLACGVACAQDFNTLKATCVQEERAACIATRWDPEYRFFNGNSTELVAYATAICNGTPGTMAYVSGPGSDVAIAAIAAHAARIEGLCSHRARELELAHRQLAVQQDLQQILKGDMQSVLAKLVPGATVTITLPKPKQ